MEPVTRVEGIVAPLDRSDVDTDQIVPKQFLKRVGRTGYGDVLFHDWRTDGRGRPDPDFVLNRKPWSEARILVSGRNFGCGSSREHAVWALHDFGFRAVVAPSFADIFFGNCFETGLVPVRLGAAAVRHVMDRARRSAYTVMVDLERMVVEDGEGRAWPFELDEHRRAALMEGRDRIAETLRVEEAIAAYEATASPPSWAVEPG